MSLFCIISKCASLQQYDLTSYELLEVQASTSTPVHVHGHECTLVGTSVISYGGNSISGQLSNQMWKYDLISRSWSRVLEKNPGPLARKG